MVCLSGMRWPCSALVVFLLCSLLVSPQAFAAPLFGNPTLLALPSTTSLPTAIALGDFNRDGKLDMVVASECLGVSCSNGAINVFLGKGDGSFAPPVQYLGLYQTIAMGVADFNGDGNLDIIVLNRCEQTPCNFSFGWVQVFLGNGDGTFQPARETALGGFFSLAMAVGDFDGDGRLDIAMSSFGGAPQNHGYIQVALGNGDGTFRNVSSYVTGPVPTAVAAADFNGDGQTDLAVTWSNHGNVDILLGNGKGLFQQFSSFHTGPGTWLTAADINGDGRMDLATTAPPVLRVTYGNGDGTFQHPVGLPIGSGSGNQVVTGDFNGDGVMDLAVAAGPMDTLDVYLNRPGKTFKKETFSSPSNPGYLAAGDLNNDGGLDIVVLNVNSNNVSVFLNAATAAQQ